MNEATQSSALDGAHVVVFGGSSGIGLAAAAAAKAKGASVTLVGRTRAKLDSAAQAIGGARVAVADIADRHAVRRYSTRSRASITWSSPPAGSLPAS